MLRAQLWKKGFIFHHDNALAYTALSIRIVQSRISNPLEIRISKLHVFQIFEFENEIYSKQKFLNVTHNAKFMCMQCRRL